MSHKIVHLTLLSNELPVAVNFARVLYIHPFQSSEAPGTVIAFPDDGAESHLTVAENYHTILRMWPSE